MKHCNQMSWALKDFFNSITSIICLPFTNTNSLFCTKGVNFFKIDEFAFRVGFKFQFFSMGAWLAHEWTPPGSYL